MPTRLAADYASLALGEDSPKSKRRVGLQPEERFQVLLVRRLRQVLPAHVSFWAIETNSNLDTRTDELRIKAINRWKRLENKGVTRDVPDLMFSWRDSFGIPRTGYIELKWGRNDLSDGQRRFLKARKEEGHFTAVCWNPSDVELSLLGWGIDLTGTLVIDLTGTLVDVMARLAVEVPVKKKREGGGKKRELGSPTKRALAIARRTVWKK